MMRSSWGFDFFSPNNHGLIQQEGGKCGSPDVFCTTPLIFAFSVASSQLCYVRIGGERQVRGNSNCIYRVEVQRLNGHVHLTRKVVGSFSEAALVSGLFDISGEHGEDVVLPGQPMLVSCFPPTANASLSSLGLNWNFAPYTQNRWLRGEV